MIDDVRKKDLKTQFLKNFHMFGPSNIIIHGYHNTRLQMLIMWGGNHIGYLSFVAETG